VVSGQAGGATGAAGCGRYRLNSGYRAGIAEPTRTNDPRRSWRLLSAPATEAETRKGSGFELEVVKVLQGYAIEAVKIPLSGSVQASPATSVRR
jgi:hypothetical protein